jgi:hypothetical protein
MPLQVLTRAHDGIDICPKWLINTKWMPDDGKSAWTLILLVVCSWPRSSIRTTSQGDAVVVLTRTGSWATLLGISWTMTIYRMLRMW